MAPSLLANHVDQESERLQRFPGIDEWSAEAGPVELGRQCGTRCHTSQRHFAPSRLEQHGKASLDAGAATGHHQRRLGRRRELAGRGEDEVRLEEWVGFSRRRSG
jgi:hypothetical protein